MDYEEAISFIKSLRKDFEKDIVDTLPYTGHEYDNDLEAEALGMAIKALEKQEMSPVSQNYDCPDCGCDLICNLHLSDLKYCPNCGNRLGWKEDYDRMDKR